MVFEYLVTFTHRNLTPKHSGGKRASGGHRPLIAAHYNALLTGKLGAQRVIFPSAATCYALLRKTLSIILTTSSFLSIVTGNPPTFRILLSISIVNFPASTEQLNILARSPRIVLAKIFIS